MKKTIIKGNIDLSTFSEVDREFIVRAATKKESKFGIVIKDQPADLEDLKIGDHLKFTHLVDNVENSFDTKVLKIEEANTVSEDDKSKFYLNMDSEAFKTADQIAALECVNIDVEDKVKSGASWLKISVYIALALGAVYGAFVAYNKYNVNLEVNKK